MQRFRLRRWPLYAQGHLPSNSMSYLSGLRIQGSESARPRRTGMVRRAAIPDTSAPGMIELRNLSKDYPDAARPAVDSLKLAIADREFLALVGPSGCGKTTTLSMINRLVEPSRGEILIDGADIRQSDPVELRRGIGFVFQDIGLFPHLTVGENAGITLRLMGRGAGEIDRRVAEVLEQVRLPPAEFQNR